MIVYRSDLHGCGRPEEFSQGTAVALGQFDSLHRGHTEIIRRVVKAAEAEGLKSLVFIFLNDLTEVICKRRVRAVNTLERRLEILEELGVDIVYIKRFDEEFMRLSPIEFIEKYLVDMLGARFVAAGYNYRFGMNGAGDTGLLTAECEKRGIRVSAADEVRLNGETVSTTVIRQRIESGDVSGAARLMGRYYSVRGVVEHGNNIGGSLLGFPTANIPIPENSVIPRLGVYISIARLDGAEYPAITNVGARPTVDEDRVCIETHIDGRFHELYGKEIEIQLCEFIREIIKFDSVDELKNRLSEDKAISKKYFKNYNERERKGKNYEEW